MTTTNLVKKRVALIIVTVDFVYPNEISQNFNNIASSLIVTLKLIVATLMLLHEKEQKIQKITNC